MLKTQTTVFPLHPFACSMLLFACWLLPLPLLTLPTVSRPSQILSQLFGTLLSKAIFALRFAKPVPKYHYKNADLTIVLVRFFRTKNSRILICI